jgi:hypothetical protein
MIVAVGMVMTMLMGGTGAAVMFVIVMFGIVLSIDRVVMRAHGLISSPLKISTTGI